MSSADGEAAGCWMSATAEVRRVLGGAATAAAGPAAEQGGGQ